MLHLHSSADPSWLRQAHAALNAQGNALEACKSLAKAGLAQEVDDRFRVNRAEGNATISARGQRWFDFQSNVGGVGSPSLVSFATGMSIKDAILWIARHVDGCAVALALGETLTLAEQTAEPAPPTQAKPKRSL